MTGSPRTAAALLGLLAVVALAAGCSDGADAPPSPFGAGAGDVDVDTARLQQLREEAGIPVCPAGLRTEPGAVDGGLPATTLPCLGGGPALDLSTLRGPLVVNLWAQWCLPCRAELPYFARLHKAGVDVLGVDFQDTQPELALSLAADSGVGYPSVADVEGSLRAPLRVVGMPTTLFVDADGRVTARLAQEFTSYAELADAVREHLGVRA